MKDKTFSMSMYASAEDLYKAKAEYYQGRLAHERERVIAECVEAGMNATKSIVNKNGMTMYGACLVIKAIKGVK